MLVAHCCCKGCIYMPTESPHGVEYRGRRKLRRPADKSDHTCTRISHTVSRGRCRRERAGFFHVGTRPHTSSKSAKYAGGRASVLRCCVVEWGVERASGATNSTSRSSGTSLANTNQNQDRKPDKTNHTSERVARLSGYRSCRETQSSCLEQRT